MDGWMDGWMDRWIDGSMDRWIDGSMDRWIDGWMDRWMDRWIDGWIDGSMDRSMDRSMDGSIIHPYMGSLHKNTQLMLVFLKALSIVLKFSYYTLMIFLPPENVTSNVIYAHDTTLYSKCDHAQLKACVRYF